MRCLNRNKRSFYYANYVGMSKLTDSGGNFTGEYGITYTNPTLVYGNISPARGADYSSPFGITEGYDKVIVLSDPNFPIDDSSVLWIENDITDTFDYRIVRIARSLNSISIAIKKVDVDAQENNS